MQGDDFPKDTGVFDDIRRAENEHTVLKRITAKIRVGGQYTRRRKRLNLCGPFTRTRQY